MLRSYALAPNTVQRLMSRIFWRFQWMTTASFAFFGVYLAFLSGPVRWDRAVPLVVVIALVYFFAIFFHYRSQLRFLYSLRYEIDGSTLIFRQLGRDPQRISRADIAAVYVRRDNLLIETVDGLNMQVPYGLARDGDENFRQTLGAWVGVVPPEARPIGQLRQMVVVGVLGALLVLLFANSLLIILPMLLATIVYGLFTERRLLNTPDAGPGTMRSYNMAFSFLIFIIVMKSCMIALSMAVTQ